MEQNDAKLFEDIADYMKAFAHPTRLRILEYLMRQKMTCVKFLWEELGLQQSNVSQHLALLRQRGIIDSRKDGVKTCYWIADEFAINLFHRLMEEFERRQEESEQKGEGEQAQGG